MEVNFRPATFQDQEGIEMLSKDVYQDTDTLNYDFTHWLKNDMWFLFVGEVNPGKIVAFFALNVSDGGESLVGRSVRVDAKYREQGIFKAMASYASRYVRERMPLVKYMWGLRSSAVRVPNGCEVIRRSWLVKAIFENFSKTKINELAISEMNVQVITWSEFKMIYESDEKMRELLNNGILSIYGSVYRLNCEVNWKYLQSRTDIHVMLSKYGDDDGKTLTFVSFLGMEKCLTNTGIPVISMNLYGVEKEALKCHIAKGLLETLKHFDSKFLFAVSVDNELVKECVNVLEELSSRNMAYQLEVNLLQGTFDKMVEYV